MAIFSNIKDESAVAVFLFVLTLAIILNLPAYDYSVLTGNVMTGKVVTDLAVGFCGNNILDAGEECDNNITRGYGGMTYECYDARRMAIRGGCYYKQYLLNYGNKTCKKLCSSGCSMYSYSLYLECNAPVSIKCGDYSSLSTNINGLIKCTDSCTLDLSECGYKFNNCGNGIIEPGELCEGNKSKRCIEISSTYRSINKYAQCSNCLWDSSTCKATINLPVKAYIDNCTTINESGYYKLKNDIISDRETCYIITATNVIFDGAGHSISGRIGTQSDAGIVIKADNTTITNFVIKNFYTAVGMAKVDNCVISNNYWSGNTYGVSMHSGRNSLITNNTMISGRYENLWISNQTEMIISDNILSNANRAIWMAGTIGPSDRLIFINNTISNNGGGIEADYLRDSLFINNTFKNNTGNLITIAYDLSTNNSFVNTISDSPKTIVFIEYSTSGNFVSYSNPFGEIQWQKSDGSLDVRGKISFPGNIIISKNLAYWSHTDFYNTSLDKSANITLYGLPNTGKSILRDGVACTDCIAYAALNNSTVKFLAPGAGNYTISTKPYANTTSNCGNGKINLGEECDGTIISNKLCSQFTNFVSGTLTCTKNCTFNYSSCVNKSIIVNNTPCTDSDGGLNYSVKGIVTMKDSGDILEDKCNVLIGTNSWNSIDECSGNCFIEEGYCNSSSKIAGEFHSCPQGCNDGVCNKIGVRSCNFDSDCLEYSCGTGEYMHEKCINKSCAVTTNCYTKNDPLQSDYCYDSDNGIDPTVFGYVIEYKDDTPIIHNDANVTDSINNMVSEWYCEDSKTAKQTSIRCTQGRTMFGCKSLGNGSLKLGVLDILNVYKYDFDLYIDGVWKAHNNYLVPYFNIYGISPGNHNIKVNTTGFTEWNKTILFKPNVENITDARVQFLENYGYLFVSVKKSNGQLDYGTQLYVDDIWRGPPPIYVTLAKGDYSITIKKDRSVIYNQTTTIGSRATTNITISPD